MFRRARAAAFVFAPLAALAVASAAGAQVNAAQSVVVSPTPASKTPNILNGIVNGIATVGNEVVVGGTFTSVKSSDGTTLNRSELLAFNPTTGVVDTNFAPVFSGGEVTTVTAAPGGTAVFVGGKFQTVNGVTAKRLVKINLSDGSINTTFQPKVSGSWVEDIQVLGNDLYVGGAFTSLGGQPRERFGAVDVNTGVADAKRQHPVCQQARRHPAGRALRHLPRRHQAGRHRDVPDGGWPGRAQIAMLDLTTTPVSVASWESDASSRTDNPSSTPTSATSSSHPTAATSCLATPVPTPAARRRACCVTRSRAGMRTPPAPVRSRPGRTTPAATASPTSPSPEPRSTRAATSAG